MENQRDLEINRIMSEYGDSMLRTAFLYLSDRYLAQDAVQDSLIKIYRSYQDFQHKSNEKTWIMRILINTCKNYRRTNWFRKVDATESLADIAGSGDNNFDETLEEVMKLPPKYKEVILLFYYQQMQIKEISQVLECPVPTVTTRLKRGKEKLKSRLEMYDE